LLSLLPVQGLPLRPSALYVAVIRQKLGKALPGPRLGVAPELAALVAGERPASFSDAALASYQKALAALRGLGIPDDDLAGLAAFTTDDPTATLAQFRADLLTRPLPMPDAPLARQEVFADYCVYKSTIKMLDYQQGMAPYDHEGGNWALDQNGKPV